MLVHLKCGRLSVIFGIALAIQLAQRNTADARTIETVAVTGQQAPGFPPGATYASVQAVDSTNLPWLNGAGNIIYWGTVSQNTNAIWSDTAGLKSLLYQTGT